jgi:hypothetical protein
MSSGLLALKRFDAWLPTLLVVGGSLLFLAGGSRHPHIGGPALGDPGSDAYFRHFAAMILERPNWAGFHTLILTGPLLWALGVAGAVGVDGPQTPILGQVARASLMMGAALWALGFVLDGYMGPRLAQGVVSAGPGSDAVAIAAFGDNAFTMARLGTISIVLLGGGVLASALALLLEGPLGSWRGAVGITGFLVAGWPLVGAARGDFDPGPYVTSYWTPMAVALGLWFLGLGTTFRLRSAVRGGNGP